MTSGYIKKDFSGGYVKLSWELVSQDAKTSTSNLKYQLSVYRNPGFSSTEARSYSITFDGNKIASGSISLAGSGTKIVKSGTTTISHSVTGVKTFSYSFTQALGSVGTISGSGTGTLPTIQRATTPSLSSSTVIMGDKLTIYMPRVDNSFTHTLKYSFNGGDVAVMGTGSGTEFIWVVPLYFAHSIPNATSGGGIITCETYSGPTLIGSKSISFTATVPDSIKPTINVAISDNDEQIAKKFGAYIQNKTRLNVEITSEGAYSSTITSYKTTIDGITYNGESFTSNPLTNSGTITLASIVTDSRGRTNEYRTNISVLEYSVPRIYSFNCYRSNSNKAANEEGQHVTCAVNFAITDLNEKNDKSYQIQYRLKGSEEWISFASGAVYALNDTIINTAINFNTDNSYEVRLVVEDYFKPVNTIANIPTAFTLIDYYSSGKGLSIGKVSEKEAFEVAIPMETAFGEIITTPFALPIGQDLNDCTEPGFYFIQSTAVAETILNKPKTGTATAFIEVLKGGNAGQKIQRFYILDKVGQFIWQRTFYEGAWGAWQMVGGGTQTVQFTPAGGVNISRASVSRQGDIVSAFFRININYAVSAGETFVVGTLPAEVAPNNGVATLGIHGTNALIVVWVEADGKVKIRPGSDYTANAAIEANLSWNITATWQQE